MLFHPFTPPVQFAQRLRRTLDRAAATALIPALKPLTRKIIYAVSFETLGIPVAGTALRVLSDATPAQRFGLSAISAAANIGWSLICNAMFKP